MSRSVEAVSRRCRLTLVSMVSRCVNCVGPVSEGGLTVYTRTVCLSVDGVECRSVERVGACRACRVCQVCRVHITTRTEARVPGRCRGALRVMLPRGLGDAGQVGDCVKQIQYVRVFEHCWVHQAARRVGGGGSNPEPHTCF